MSAGKKVAIGCGGILVLILLAGGFGVRWVYKNFGWTNDDEAIRVIASEILPVQIPEPFDPLFGGYSRRDKQDPFAIFLHQESRTQESAMVLYARDGSFDREEMFADISAEHPGLQVSAGVEAAGQEEVFEVTYEGQTYEVLLEEGLDEDQVMIRNLVLVMPGEGRTILVMFSGDPKSIDRDLVQRTLDQPLPPEALLPAGTGEEGQE